MRKKLKILFVVAENVRVYFEDDIFLLKREMDFMVEEANDASLVLEALEKEKYDCIIIETSYCCYSNFSVYKGKREGDCFLEKKGVQAILDLKEKNPEQKIIALTTNPFENFFSYLSEISDFCLKIPFNNTELVKGIRKVCGCEEKGKKSWAIKPYSPFYSMGTSLKTGPFFKRPKRRY